MWLYMNRIHLTLNALGFREVKDLKTKQAKQSVETVKALMADKAIRNKAEKERYVNAHFYGLTKQLHTRIQTTWFDFTSCFIDESL